MLVLGARLVARGVCMDMEHAMVSLMHGVSLTEMGSGGRFVKRVKSRVSCVASAS